MVVFDYVFSVKLRWSRCFYGPKENDTEVLKQKKSMTQLWIRTRLTKLVYRFFFFFLLSKKKLKDLLKLYQVLYIPKYIYISTSLQYYLAMPRKRVYRDPSLVCMDWIGLDWVWGIFQSNSNLLLRISQFNPPHGRLATNPICGDWG